MTRARFGGLLSGLEVVLTALLGLTALAVPTPAKAQSAEWTVILVVRPNPSPYIADWQTDPSLVTLVLSYTGNAPVPFHLEGRVQRGSARVLGGRSTAYEFVRPTQLVLTSRDGIWDAGSVSYDAAVQSTLERTGRIPEGTYQFCVDVVRGIPEAPTGLITTQCESFTLTAPEPPSLIVPADGDSVRAEYPSFAWTPVMAPPGVAVRYQVRIAEVLPGQSPISAIGNIPQLETAISSTSMMYPTDGYALRDSARYVWQVQSLDAAGEPLGERQGKSEIGQFVYSPATRAFIPDVTVATADPEVLEPAVNRFTWSGVEVKVLSLVDSSYGNYTGRGRVRIIPGVFEPKIRFRGVRLASDGKSVAFAPRHRVKLPTFGSYFGWGAALSLAVPAGIHIEYLDLVADSATGEKHVGISGEALVFIPFGTTEDEAIAAYDDEMANMDAATRAQYTADKAAYEQARADEALAFSRCENDVGESPADDASQAEQDAFSAKVAARREYCLTLLDEDLKEPAKPGEGYSRAWEDKWAQIKQHWLTFRFTDLRIGAAGPLGTLTLGRTWESQNIGMSGFRMTLYKDETALQLENGRGALDLKGDFTIPPSTGLVRDLTIAPPKRPPDVRLPDPKAIVLKVEQARLTSRGEFYAQVEGIPRALIGSTGIKFRTGETWIDFSSELSPTGRPASWQGIYLDSARVFLPDDFQKANAGETGVSIAGYKLTVDESGFSGKVFGSNLEQLGAIGFGGFSGRLDTLQLIFQSGTLDSGYVAGILTVPFLEGPVPYWANFTPVGIGQAYAKIDQQRIAIPALKATATIQRGEFTYDRPLGTFSMDAKVDIDYDGISLNQAQLYGLTISSDGALKLGSGWLSFDASNEAGFKGFPVALDSIGFGSGTTGDEVWLGLAGRFQLNENLPSGSGAFRLFASRPSPGQAWGFSRLEVNRLDMRYQNAAVEFGGGLTYLQDDPIYGDAFRAAVQLRVKDQFSVNGNFIVGSTSSAASSTSAFRYWYVDAKVLLPPPGIQLGPIPLSIYGFGGGAYSRMRAVIDPVQRTASYVPDANTAFGLKALVSIGTSASQGYPWNADVTLEAAVAASGGLNKLTMYGDFWMLTDVSTRQERIWGKVLVDLPVSTPVFHATMDAWVNIPPALTGEGSAELHFEPNDWHIWVGTRSDPNEFTLYPGSLELPGEAYFMMDRLGIDAGFSTFLEKTKTSGNFYGRVAAGFEATAQMRYRPFMARGDGELWGEIVAKYKDYTLLSGNASATMAFTLPDPMGIWGRVKIKYKLMGGTVKGTYRMRYSWGDRPDEEDDAAAAFVLLAGTAPLANDAQAPLGGIAYFLGMGEGTLYGLEDGSTWRLYAAPAVVEQRTTSTRQSCAPPIRRGAAPVCTPVSTFSWPSIGTVLRDYDEERYTMTLRPPGYGLLAPAQTYRARTTFQLQKQQADGSWTNEQSRTDTVTFTTVGTTEPISQYVESVDPAGTASPFYHAGENAGVVRMRFSNIPAEIASRAVVGRVVSAAGGTVAGTWAATTYPKSLRSAGGDPRLYGFTPAPGALAPQSTYRLVLVGTDSLAEELYNVPFVTSRHASLDAHVAASAITVSPNWIRSRTGAATALRSVSIVLAGAESINWDDVEEVELVSAGRGVTADITPRSRCQWAPSPRSITGGFAIGRSALCATPPVYESAIDVEFTGTLPEATTSSITLRIRHRREGERLFSFPIPPAGAP